MVKFVDVDPADINTDHYSKQGGVSYPIIKAFMERNSKVSKLSPSEEHKDPTILRSVLTAYIRSHNMPIKIFASGGELHLMRLDLDDDGNEIEWKPGDSNEKGG